MAYDRIALQLLGPDALRNFPKKKVAPATLAEARTEARRLYKERTSSKYRGVTWSKKERCWLAHIAHRKTSHRLGTYTSELKAARAYDRAAQKMHGARAVLNFRR